MTINFSLLPFHKCFPASPVKQPKVGGPLQSEAQVCSQNSDVLFLSCSPLLTPINGDSAGHKATLTPAVVPTTTTVGVRVPHLFNIMGRLTRPQRYLRL